MGHSHVAYMSPWVREIIGNKLNAGILGRIQIVPNSMCDGLP